MKYNILVETKSYDTYFLLNKPFIKHNLEVGYKLLKDLDIICLYFVRKLVFIKYEI